MDAATRIECLRIKVGINAELVARMEKLKPRPRYQEFTTWLWPRMSISGGISASVYHNETVKDIDMWCNCALEDFKTQSHAIDALFIDSKGMFHDLVKDINPSYMVGEVNGKLITANAITLYEDFQIIRLSNIDDARKTFDFVHCQPVYSLARDTFRITQQQFDAIKNKKLIEANPVTNKIQTNRIEKFKSRGWSF